MLIKEQVLLARERMCLAKSHEFRLGKIARLVNRFVKQAPVRDRAPPDERTLSNIWHVYAGFGDPWGDKRLTLLLDYINILYGPERYTYQVLARRLEELRRTDDQRYAEAQRLARTYARDGILISLVVEDGWSDLVEEISRELGPYG